MDNMETRYLDKLLMDNNAKLLYLTKFGSILYGTNGETSDTNYKGIFICNNKECTHLNFSTSKDRSKTTNKDVDIDLYSLEHFLFLLKQGTDVEVIDLLFSISNPDCIEYMSIDVCTIFNNPLKFLNTSVDDTYRGYCLSQVQKYGIKQTKLDSIATLYKYVSELDDTTSLSDIITVLDALVPTEKLLSHIENGILHLYYKDYPLTMKVSDLKVLLKEELKTFDPYVGVASSVTSFKNVSHAIRILIQWESIINTGRVDFPLKESNMIKSFKYHMKSLEEAEDFINIKLSELTEKQNHSPFIKNCDDNFVQSFMTNFNERWKKGEIQTYINDTEKQVTVDNQIKAIRNESRFWVCIAMLASSVSLIMSISAILMAMKVIKV